MRKPMSLRLRVTLLCAALLTLCCLLLTVTNNFSAIRMADAIQAVPLLPAQRAELEDSVSLPMAELHISDTIQQAQGAFHMQSLLAMVAILALGLFLIYRLVGKALAPLDTLTCRIRERTAADLAQPVEIPDSGDEAAALALAFNQMSQRLNQVFVMQRNFSRNAAHEFRTPLTLIITPLESLIKEVGDIALKKRLQSIYRNSKELLNLVNQLLDFRRLEVHGEKLFLVKGNIAEFVSSIKSSFDYLAQEKEISFEIDDKIAEDLYISFDREKIQKVLNNLLSNAFKFTPAGGMVTITLDTCREPDGVQYFRLCVKVWEWQD